LRSLMHLPAFSRRLRRAGAGLLALSLAAAASGAARAESYFSVYFGQSKTESSNLRIQNFSTNTDATFHGVGWDDHSFESPPWYGIKLGGWSESDPNWGVELDFVHYKVYARTDETVPVSGTWNGAPLAGSQRLDTHVQRFDISHGVNFIGLSVLYRLTGRPTPSFPHGRIQPYVGAGPTYYIQHPENRIDGVPNKQRYEFDGLGWQALGGVRYGVSRKVTAFVEAKYSQGRASVATAGGGSASTHLRTWHGTGGIQYGF
jgi:lipid A oxidase